MSELREKVAISLRCAELWRDMDGVGTLETYGIDNRECEKLADAAIAAVLEAMQEPSPAMLDRFVSRALCVSVSAREDGASTGGTNGRRCWRAFVRTTGCRAVDRRFVM